MDTHSSWLHDPQPILWRFGIQGRNGTAKHSKNALHSLGLRAKHPDTRKLRWRILSYICKVHIERDEDAILCARHFDDVSVGLPAQVFIQYCLHVVPGCAE